MYCISTPSWSLSWAEIGSAFAGDARAQLLNNALKDTLPNMYVWQCSGRVAFWRSSGGDFTVHGILTQWQVLFETYCTCTYNIKVGLSIIMCNEFSFQYVSMKTLVPKLTTRQQCKTTLFSVVKRTRCNHFLLHITILEEIVLSWNETLMSSVCVTCHGTNVTQLEGHMLLVSSLNPSPKLKAQHRGVGLAD